MVRLAARLGFAFVGLRLQPNALGAPHQRLIGDAAILRETRAALADTGVGVFDIEIIRIGAQFDLAAQQPLLEAGAALGARAVLVAADDPEPARLAHHFVRLCEAMLPFGLTADLEFMPWTAVKTAREALATVQTAGTPRNAGILVDAIHFGRSATTLADIAALPRSLLHYAQIGDASTPESLGRALSVDEMIHTARCERLLPGEGAIDLRGLFAALPQDLPVSVEICSDSRVAQLGVQAWAKQALAASRALLEPSIPI
jgi:sugar phosphate isomerase/epimerase